MAGIINTPYISVIIPTFQSAAFLPTALDSILRQTFANLEVLIMDGLSRDDTVRIAKEYATADNRVRVYSEPDKGIYDAMNKGIAKARGEWILFLGSDDRLQDEQVFRQFVRSCSAAGYDMAYGNVVSPSYKGTYDGEFTFEKLLRRNMPHQAIFYRRPVFDLVGLFEMRYKGYADWDMNIRCFKDKRINIGYIDLVVAWFGADGVSSRHDVVFLREVMIPEQLRLLNRHSRRLISVKTFDEWWRLIRNSGIRDLAAFESYRGSEKTPRSVKRMVVWQGRVPLKLLRVGLFSKIIMFLNYIANLLTGSI